MTSNGAKKIKNSGSKIERILGSAMWQAGLRYRKQCKNVYGRPDFCFKNRQIAIFCDSEFWHGYNLTVKHERFKTNESYWLKKIFMNIQRDRAVDMVLKSKGWLVLRFWGKEILNDTDTCVKIIKEALNATV